MKRFIYIIFLLTIACGGGKDGIKISQKSGNHQSLKQHFDKKILPVKPAVDHTKDSLTQDSFNALARQKMLQFFDMINLIKQKKSSKDFESFTTENAKKLWLKPENAKQFLQQPAIQKADSLELRALTFQKFQTQQPDELLAVYRLRFKIFRNGQTQLRQTQAQFYFKILHLDVDGQTYQSLKAKIFRIGKCVR